MLTPTIGRIVTVLGGTARVNGTDSAPAVITRVWSDELVNVTVLCDAPTTGRHTSITLCPDEESARAKPEGQPEAYAVAYWPVRV